MKHQVRLDTGLNRAKILKRQYLYLTHITPAVSEPAQGTSLTG